MRIFYILFMGGLLGLEGHDVFRYVVKWLKSILMIIAKIDCVFWPYLCSLKFQWEEKNSKKF